jgi:hypothetical protein
MKTIKNIWRAHIDVAGAVYVLLIVTIFYRPLLSKLAPWISAASANQSIPQWVKDLVPNVVGELVAAGIIALIIYWVFRIRAKASIVGEFDAYDLADGKEKAWGTVTLTFNPFTQQIRGLLVSAEHDATLILEGIFERGQFLRGHYAESSKLGVRRQGAFLLELLGDGNTYEGAYVFVDPGDAKAPESGKVRWKRKT